MSKAKHYYLVAGEILFRDPTEEGSSGLGSIKLNTLIVNEQPHVTAAHLGKAQQVLQMEMFKRLGDEKLQVIDVFIIGLSHLGLMTEAKFKQAPEGTMLQERAEAVADAIFAS